MPERCYADCPKEFFYAECIGTLMEVVHLRVEGDVDVGIAPATEISLGRGQPQSSSNIEPHRRKTKLVFSILGKTDSAQFNGSPEPQKLTNIANGSVILPACSRRNITKLFTSVFTYTSNKLMFAPGKPFQPSLTIVGKAKSLP
jgi:hypothetical protein